ncbi:M20 family metallopeptidase [Leucobacter viscericola]|uniref:M20 family metallopeptidase n=2 Tax=Leucobacter viscericola TaxID=2714935 RepID=A0A6G7XK16_9MICO|nr:M20 family metallopeptidase [Leucobacter viscericola]
MQAMVAAVTSEFEFLRTLVEIESPSYDRERSAQVTAPIAERLRRIGGSVRLLETEAGTNLVADFPGEGRPLLLVGHTDTVWPVGTLDSQIPWHVGEGTITGPGIYDMKSGIAVMCAALEHVGGRPKHPVRIILTCDEEVGSPTSQHFIREHVADARAAIGFESPHPDGALKVGRRGSTRLMLRVFGRSAHAALNPELGASAIDELVDQLLAIRALTADPTLDTPVLCNVGTIQGGRLANVVPEEARAEIGLRFVDAATEAQVLTAIRTLPTIRAHTRIEVETLSSRPAWSASLEDQALLGAIHTAGERIGQTVEGRPAAGAGDTNLIGSLGVPTVDGFGPLGGGAHALNEHIVTESLPQRIKLLTEVLRSPLTEY